MSKRTDIASKINRYGQSVCGLQTFVLRRNSEAAQTVGLRNWRFRASYDSFCGKSNSIRDVTKRYVTLYYKPQPKQHELKQTTMKIIPFILFHFLLTVTGAFGQNVNDNY